MDSKCSMKYSKTEIAGCPKENECDLPRMMNCTVKSLEKEKSQI